MSSKRLLLLSLVSLLGCATSRGEADLLGMPEIRTVTAGSVNPSGQSVATTFRYEEQPVLVEELVDGGVGDVLLALLAAYRSEGLIPDDIDAESGVVSLSRVEWSGERNGQRLSALLDCGLSATGRPMADDARIVAAVAARVREAEPPSARVTLRLSASAYPYESLGGRVRECVTTGELEHAILERVRLALAPAPAAAGPTAGAPRPPTAGDMDLPFSSGDRLRVWVSPSEHISGAFLLVRLDTLLLGTGRRTPIPLERIQKIQVQRTSWPATVTAVLVGIAAGVAIATTTDLGIHGQHGSQGRLLNPGLGALTGGLAGALVASITFGTSWVQVPVGTVRPRSGFVP
ncbi:MAG: hypothetical protein Q8N53_03230 [Longimicrobiales bacterium]|nr:hypothetical protein [Longimicrobiales bacterium]